MKPTRIVLAAISTLTFIAAMALLNTLVLVGFSVEVSFAMTLCLYQLLAFLRTETIGVEENRHRAGYLIVINILVTILLVLWCLFMPTWAFKALVVLSLFGMIGEPAVMLLTSDTDFFTIDVTRND